MTEKVFTRDLAKFQPKQLEAWHALFTPECKYLLYGGAMHGGKSYFLRWAALGLAMYYAAETKSAGTPVGLFSEDYPTLKDRQLSKMVHEFPPELGELKSSQEEGLCYFIHPKYGGGRILLRNLDDPSKYMSTEFAAILVEELTKNPLETFQNLRTRLRYPGIKDVRFVGATNPGGVGHVWCKSYWIDKNSGDFEQEKFKYVKATLDDNKFTTREYRAQLESLPERQRKAFRDGSWDAFEGQFFSSFNRSTQVIKPFQIDARWEFIGSMDPGWASPLSFGLQARDFNGNEYRIATYYEKDRNPGDHAQAISEFIKNDKYTQGRFPSVIVSGKDAWARKDRHAVIASEKTMADAFQTAGLFLQPATTDRKQGWGSLKAVMPKHYFIFDGFNQPLVDQLLTTLSDEREPEDIQGKGNDPKVEDHAIDDARYGHFALYQPALIETAREKTWEEELESEAADHDDYSGSWRPGLG